MSPRPQKHTWGGKRTGAGRPPGEQTRHRATFLLDEQTAALIAARAEADGVTRSEALMRCLREWGAAREAAE